MTLITQHKPIQRSTDMAVMIKTSQIQAWLNGLYTEHRASKHIHAGRRPGAPAPMMIQRKPTLTQQTIQRSRHFVFQSTPDLPAHDSGSCGSVCFIMFLLLFSSKDQRPLDAPFFLPSKLQLFREPICKKCAFLFFLKMASVYPRMSFCQNTILPQYCFGQNVILPKYHVSKILFCQNIILPEYCLPKKHFATICLQNDRPKSSQNINLGRPQTLHFAQSLRAMVPLEPSSPVIATHSYLNISQISILAWGDGSTGAIVPC